MKRVLIRGRGGEEYSVAEGDFAEYEERGFKIVSYEDGAEYDGEKRTKRKTTKRTTKRTKAPAAPAADAPADAADNPEE